MRIAQTKTRPLEFLKLLAHDIRWRIVETARRSRQGMLSFTLAPWRSFPLMSPLSIRP